MSAYVETTRVHYLCRDWAPEPIGSRNFGEKNEQELVIYDPVGLPGSHSLFEVWSDCFLAFLFVWRFCSPSKATESCFWQILYSVSVFVLDIRRIRR